MNWLEGLGGVGRVWEGLGGELKSGRIAATARATTVATATATAAMATAAAVATATAAAATEIRLNHKQT